MAEKNERALGMLKTALSMEEKGYQFYEKVVATSGNELGRRIFQMLKEDEITHVERIQRLFQQLSGGQDWTDDWKIVTVQQRDLSQIFHRLAEEHRQRLSAEAGDLEAIDVGLDFELKAVNFYREHLAHAQNELEREFIRAMVAEEELHHELLADMKLYLTDPNAWFREREKGGLDGA
ncbi:MAG: ferritin family protein [Myxococcales bacterium]|nr:ferritin family protein [Myxococcales bacterium]